MPKDTQISEADAILSAGNGDGLGAGFEGAEATEAYLGDARAALGAAQHEQPDHADDEPAEEKLYLGKYKSVADLEKAARHFQSEADRNRQDAELARKYPSFLEAVQVDPLFRDHVMKFYDEDGNEVADDGAEPTPITRKEARKIAAEEARRVRASEAEEQSKAQMQKDYENQLAQLIETYHLTDDQVSDFLATAKGRQWTMTDLYKVLHMPAEIDAAVTKGQRAALDQVSAAGRTAPAIGVTPGVGVRKRDIGDLMGDEILAAERGGNTADADKARALGII